MRASVCACVCPRVHVCAHVHACISVISLRLRVPGSTAASRQSASSHLVQNGALFLESGQQADDGQELCVPEELVHAAAVLQKRNHDVCRSAKRQGFLGISGARGA